MEGRGETDEGLDPAARLRRTDLSLGAPRVDQRAPSTRSRANEFGAIELSASPDMVPAGRHYRLLRERITYTDHTGQYLFSTTQRCFRAYVVVDDRGFVEA
jgi:hypothetical protein